MSRTKKKTANGQCPFRSLWWDTALEVCIGAWLRRHRGEGARAWHGIVLQGSRSGLTHFYVQIKKKGGLIYQSISKSASSELGAYPDKPGSPKVAWRVNLGHLGHTGQTKVPLGDTGCGRRCPKHKIPQFLQGSEPKTRVWSHILPVALHQPEPNPNSQHG